MALPHTAFHLTFSLPPLTPFISSLPFISFLLPEFSITKSRYTFCYPHNSIHLLFLLLLYFFPCRRFPFGSSPSSHSSTSSITEWITDHMFFLHTRSQVLTPSFLLLLILHFSLHHHHSPHVSLYAGFPYSCIILTSFTVHHRSYGLATYSVINLPLSVPLRLLSPLSLSLSTFIVYTLSASPFSLLKVSEQ